MHSVDIVTVILCKLPGAVYDCRFFFFYIYKCCLCFLHVWCHAVSCLFVSLDTVLNLMYVCVFSLNAVWAARRRVRQMRRLLWWALTTVIRHCRFASVRSSEITAVLHKANKPAARSEFKFLPALHPPPLFFIYTSDFFKFSELKVPHICNIAPALMWYACKMKINCLVLKKKKKYSYSRHTVVHMSRKWKMSNTTRWMNSDPKMI